MRLRRLLASFTAAATSLTGAAVLLPATPAAAAGPTRILNTATAGGLGSVPSWLESQSMSDDGSGRRMTVTFLAEHAAGRRITKVFIDNGITGSDSTPNVTPEIYPGPTTNGMETSRVTLTFDPGRSGSFSCPFAGGATRRVTRTMGFRVIDNTGEQSSLVSFNGVRQVENGDCFGRTDFIDIFNQSQSATTAVPGQNVTFTFQGDDADSTGGNDHFDKYKWRLRRLNDGFTTGFTEVNPGGNNDNDTLNLTVSFPSRGRWVVEIEPGGEDGYGDSGSLFRLGGVDVNEAAAPSASIDFTASPPSALFASTPPSVNAGTPVSAVLSTSDSGGRVQVAEWDATNNGSFERMEYTVPSAGSSAHPFLSAADLTQSITTSTAGTQSVRARVTDNGALDGADNLARQNTTSAELRVNAIPTANAQTVTTPEDTAKSFTLTGADADNQPSSLKYQLVTAPPASAGSLSCSSIPACTFTPAANFNGSTTATFRTADGPVTSGANAGQAWATSATATVTINVTAVNDAPTANPQSRTTPEDTPLSITLTGSDVEPGALTYGITTPPTHGTLSGSGANRTYTPAADFNGSDSFVFSVTDSGSLVGTATVSIAVTSVNDAPVAIDQTLNTDEDSSLSFSLVATDVDGDTVAVSAPAGTVAGGALSCLGTACTYTPSPDFNGVDSFTFTADDGTGSSNSTSTGTITINVASVNDAPQALAQSVTLDEDTPTDITLEGTDVDGDALAFQVTDDPDHGSTTPVGGPVVTYTPDANYAGGDQFDFTVSDAEPLSDTATVALTINPVNDAPTVAAQAFSTDEDTAQILSVVASDIDGDDLTFSVDGAGPTNGTLTGSLPDIGYLPSGNFHGTDSFDVAVSDGVAVVIATITITVAPVNDAPFATPVAVETDEDTSAAFALVGSDVDGDALTFAVTDTTTVGDLDCVAEQCTYTPAADFHGGEVAVFSVSDGTLEDTASVAITVRPVNDAPVPAFILVTTDEDTAAAITLSAADVDGDHLEFEVASAPAHGTVAGTAPTLVYTPNANVFGTDSIDYTVSDGTTAVTGTVIISIEPVNDAPQAIDVSASTPEDTAVDFTLDATDVDSSTLTYSVDSPDEGSVDCDEADCTYTPAADATGVVVFGFSVSDGELSDGGLVTIAVAGENDAPVADDSATTTDEDTPVGVTLVASDIDGDELTYQVQSGPADGTLSGTAPDLVYTPAANFAGDDAFVWTASDGNGGSVIATVSIEVVAVNDAPVALPRVVDTDEDTPVTFSLLGEDVEGDDLTYVADAPAVGAVSCTPAGACTYTPAPDHAGTDSFTFTVTDSAGASSSATVTLTIEAAPLISTSLVGEAAVARVQVNILGQTVSGGIAVFPSMQATLTQGEAGAGLAGRTITFTVGSTVICSAVTDAAGVGTCSSQGSLSGLGVLLGLGYDVRFDGDADYAPSSARGPIAQVLTLRL